MYSARVRIGSKTDGSKCKLQLTSDARGAVALSEVKESEARAWSVRQEVPME